MNNGKVNPKDWNQPASKRKIPPKSRLQRLADCCFNSALKSPTERELAEGIWKEEHKFVKVALVGKS